MLPLLFETILWDVVLSGRQCAGIFCVLCSFVLLNLRGTQPGKVQKGYYGWVILLFFANGIYSTIFAAQQRWSGHSQRTEFVTIIFLTMAVVSFLYLVVGCGANPQTAFQLRPQSWCCGHFRGAALRNPAECMKGEAHMVEHQIWLD